MNKDTKCLIWKTPALEIATDPDGFLRLNSVRVCGKYMIHSDQLESVNELLDDRGKARLTTWLINQRQQGELCPKINRQDIEVAKNAQDMRVLKRLDRVLEFLGTLIKSPISGVTMNPNPIKEDGVPDGRTTVYYQLMAYSESITWEGDLKKLLEHLVKNKLIKKMDLSRDHYYCVLEMSGFEYVEHLHIQVKVYTQSGESLHCVGGCF